MAQRFDPFNRKVLGELIDLGRRTGIEPHNQRGMFAVSPAGPTRRKDFQAAGNQHTG